MERAKLPAIREHGVQAHEFLHLHLAAAERERETVEAFLARQRDAAAFQKIVETRPLELIREFDGGEIAAPRERVGGRDRTRESAVKILRLITAETPRRVLHDAARMDQPLVN